MKRFFDALAFLSLAAVVLATIMFPASYAAVMIT